MYSKRFLRLFGPVCIVLVDVKLVSSYFYAFYFCGTLYFLGKYFLSEKNKFVFEEIFFWRNMFSGKIWKEGRFESS